MSCNRGKQFVDQICFVGKLCHGGGSVQWSATWKSMGRIGISTELFIFIDRKNRIWTIYRRLGNWIIGCDCAPRYVQWVFGFFFWDWCSVGWLTVVVTDQQIGTLLYRDIQYRFFDFLQKILKECDINPAVGRIPMKWEQPIYGDQVPNFTDFAAPGVILSNEF